jgi:hypothetical protein
LTRPRRELATSTQTHPMNTPWSDYFQQIFYHIVFNPATSSSVEMK